ncbi:MAG: hypothetical protein ABIQ52_03455 [Vicinamibacterales bacterium]
MQQRLVAVMFCVTGLCGAWSAYAAKAELRSVIVYEGPDAAAHRGALLHAIELLPRAPATVAIIDASEARPEVQKVLRRLDAFIVEGSRVVYVVKQSALLRGAIAGSSLHRHALAAVLWHEMAHAEGADEREARAKEQALWTNYVRDQRVDSLTALRYLTALDHRPDDQLQARR